RLVSEVACTVHYDETEYWSRTDSSQVEQVVANVAITARHAMPEGGHLAISTRNAASLPADVPGGSALSGNWVVLELSDTGQGMDEKTRLQIFEPFFTTKPAGKGTGLGLATVYGIVKQSGGHIRVQRSPGEIGRASRREG